MNTFAMLVRREFWEHRSLWIAPLVWVGIIVILFAWGLFVIARHEHVMPFTDAPTVEQMQGLTEEQREDVREALKARGKHDDTISTFSFLAISGLISVFAMIVLFFYLIDCLFTERRDRSILFWKSLPVSDTQVVLSKLAVVLVLVPLGVIALSAVTQLLMFALWSLRFSGTVVGMFTPDWSLVSWFRALLVNMSVMLGGILWYAPIAAYFLLLSVWARKLVFLWAIVPLVALPILEGFFFHSTHVLQFLGQRFSGYVREMNINPIVFTSREGGTSTSGQSVQDIYQSMSLSGIFTSGEMWLGLIAAAAMVFVTIYVRRHRDET